MIQHSMICQIICILFLVIAHFSDGAIHDGELYSGIDESVNNVLTSIASKKEEPIAYAPGVVSVITRTEMERFGARTLKDVLIRMPGTNMSTTYMAT